MENNKYKEADKEAYNKGLNDAWELMQKIIEMYTEDTKGAFGEYAFKISKADRNHLMSIMNSFTPQEAIATLEAYEKEQNYIKVGDVVVGEDVDVKGVVAKVKGNNIYILFRDGSAGEHKKTDFTKTSKHIDIQKMLDELKEGVENA